MSTFQESGLRFDFDHYWTVRKYDTHRFFQGFSGVGLKGVDFIAVREANLILLEVKNYCKRQPWQPENPFERISEAPEDFARRIAKKYLDTLRALRAIGTYYRRQWGFRLLRPLLLRWPGTRSDWAFWAQVDAYLQSGQPVVAVLWLETEQEQAAFREVLQQSLETLLEGKVKAVQIRNLKTKPYPEGIRVSLAAE